MVPLVSVAQQCLLIWRVVLLSFLKCEQRIKLVFRYFQLTNKINGKHICTKLRAVLIVIVYFTSGKLPVDI